jgi:GNAT superfamily N-acetyltransferase
MSDIIRPAINEDLNELLHMADEKRARYAAWQPVFHRPHPEARERHRAYLKDLLHASHSIMLVYERSGSAIGFALGELRGAPPVYEISGKIIVVDDFCVREESLWPGVGPALLKAMWQKGREQGATLMKVVCGPKDEAKRKAIESCGLSVASEWWVGTPNS